MARGDHIKVRRFGFIYAHHGIDMGDGSVINFVEKSKGRSAQVARTSLADFAKGGRLRTVEHGSCLAPDETVRLAEAELGGQGYHLVWNNCEHFATYCKTGRKKSTQVMRGLVAAVSLAAVATSTWFVRRNRGKRDRARDEQTDRD